jgi:glutaredoxin 3
MADKTPVTVYSAVWCGFCKMAKQYLKEQGVAYEDKDVEKDPDAGTQSIEKSGQMGVPVLDIGGDIIVGFDRPRIDAALQKHKLI